MELRRDFDIKNEEYTFYEFVEHIVFMSLKLVFVK